MTDPALSDPDDPRGAYADGANESVESPAEVDSPRAPEDAPPLRDVLEASVPVLAADEAGLESIIWDADADGRERIVETDEYPYRAIASLEITARDGSRYVGTGWFVSPHTLITAGHCVYVHDALNPAANGWVRSVTVIPGRNGTGPGSRPFGSVVATRFRSVAGWVNQGDPESDYAAIILPPGSAPNGGQVGTFEIAAYSDAELRALDLSLAGYPADKQGSETQTMWFDVKKTKRVTARQIFYDVDTYGGQSGAPVYVVRENRGVAVAIHAYGTSAAVTSNSGTRITEAVASRIHSWKT